MSDAPITLRSATGDDLARVAALLAANDLPAVDVHDTPARFFLAFADGALVGVGGLEGDGPAGLLRSLAVREARRGRGYGTALCAALEDEARARGIETLYLLTTTAPAFFRRNGYEAVDRESAPASVRATTQFRDLCPASAVCMRKRLR